MKTILQICHIGQNTMGCLSIRVAVQKQFVALLAMVLVTVSGASAQTVLAVAGGVNKVNQISLEWTVGEMATETVNAPTRMYTMGFHQPLRINKTALPFPKLDLLPDHLFVVAPNPVVSAFAVNINQQVPGRLQLQLTDAFGRTLQAIDPSFNRSFRFNLRNQPSGMYYLFIRNDQGRMVKRFSIIKAN